jgi:hypothetical protein
MQRESKPSMVHDQELQNKTGKKWRGGILGCCLMTPAALLYCTLCCRSSCCSAVDESASAGSLACACAVPALANNRTCNTRRRVARVVLGMVALRCRCWGDHVCLALLRVGIQHTCGSLPARQQVLVRAMVQLLAAVPLLQHLRKAWCIMPG